jgi:hypothetical protein
MTHDELLYAISAQLVHLPPYALGGPAAYLQALCAVVELHKPKYWQGIEMVCEGCGMNIEQNYNSEYPCDTIQAIERELINVRA